MRHVRVPGRGTHFVRAHVGFVGFEPRNLREAKRHPSWPLWKEAILSEHQGLRDHELYDMVPRSQVPVGAQILSSMYTFKDKLDKAKARLVVHGHRQRHKPSAVDKYAATPSLTSFRILVATATQNDAEIDHLDVSQAFTQSAAFTEDEHVYVAPPEFSGTPSDYVWRLRRPLYGLICAPSRWYQTLSAYFVTDGWQQLHGEACLYSKTTASGSLMLASFYVDDVLLSYHRSDAAEAQAFTTRFRARFRSTALGPLQHYLGIDVFRDREAGTTTLSQEQSILDLLERHGMSPDKVNPADTPLSPGCHLTSEDCPVVPDKIMGSAYREIVGSMLWFAGATRPDISHAAQALSRFTSNPGDAHWREVKRSLRYLSGTTALGLTYTRSESTTLHPVSGSDASRRGRARVSGKQADARKEHFPPI